MGDATKLALAVFLISCSSGGCEDTGLAFEPMSAVCNVCRSLSVQNAVQMQPRGAGGWYGVGCVNLILASFA